MLLTVAMLFVGQLTAVLQTGALPHALLLPLTLLTATS